MHIFTEELNSCEEWHDCRKAIAAFIPLVDYILHKENLPPAAIERAMPGTNAVFKVGEYVIKIFTPLEFASHNGFGTDFNVELFGVKWANDGGVPSPKLVASGIVEDRYRFYYMIMEYIDGKRLNKVEKNLSYKDKVIIGENVRKITDKLNLSCENFTTVDLMEFAKNNTQWKDEGFPESFLAELSMFLQDFQVGQKVYCHGDFHEGNLLVDNDLNVFLVDFADAMYAPKEYELVYIVSSLFGFEKPYMAGYFGEDHATSSILELCMKWLPVHAWSHGLLADEIGPAEEVTSFAVMRVRLLDWIVRMNEK